MPMKIGGGNQWQEYDPSNGRYGRGGDDPFGFRPYAYYHITSKRIFRHSKKERTINPNKQNRHLGIQADGRSYLYGTLADAQKIVDDYSGKGVKASPDGSKERVRIGRIVGVFVHPKDGPFPSDWVMIVYSKTGCHVYPSDPRKGGTKK